MMQVASSSSARTRVFACPSCGGSVTIRANGIVLMPLIIMIVGLFVCRLGFALIAQPWLHFDALWWAFPVGSIASAALTWAYYRQGGWKKSALVEQAERAEHAPA